jgi:hypothetical protein
LKKNNKIFFHGLLFLFFTFLLCTFQSVIWFQLFGNLTSPFLSFVLFVYFGLDKDSWKSLLFCYSIVYIYSLFTYTSIGMLYFSSMITFLFLFIVKNRVYWPGPIYFTIMTSSSLFLFHLSYILSSLAFESRHTPLLLGSRFLQLVWTSIVAYFSYHLIKKIDISFKPEILADIHRDSHGDTHG